MSADDKFDEVYEFVVRFISERGYAPTIRQVQEGVGYASASSAHNAIWALIGEGRLFGSPGRSLRLSP